MNAMVEKVEKAERAEKVKKPGRSEGSEKKYRRKIPPSAFSDYLAMGQRRSLSKLAKKLGVSRAGMTKFARKEKFEARLRDYLEDENRSLVNTHKESKAIDEAESDVSVIAPTRSDQPQFRAPWVVQGKSRQPEIVRLLIRAVDILEKIASKK